MMLDSQAEEYEAIINDVQRTWFKRTTLFSILFLIVGILGTAGTLYYLMR